MLAVVLLTGSLFVYRLQVRAQTSYAPYCSDDVCFITPFTQKNWDDAQLWCKYHNSSLTIPDNPDRRMKFNEALQHFNMTDGGVWIGGKATYIDSQNWKWVDGTPYDASPGLQRQSSFENSYAFLNQTGSVMAYASPANISYPYLCQYPASAVNCTNSSNQIAFYDDGSCYILYAEKLSWFSARNNCIFNGGDLAKFRSLSSISFPTRGSYWVGLRSSWWNWTNPVGLTSESTDVTYTQWQVGQPNDNAPNCISTNEGSYDWRDWNCSRQLNFICQNASRVYTTTSATSKASHRPNTPSVSLANSYLSSSTTADAVSTASNNSTQSVNNMATKASQPTSSSVSSTSSFPTFSSSNSTQTTGSNVIALGVGIGVGVGVPLIIAIVVVIIVVVKKNRRNNTENVTSRSRSGIMNDSKQKAATDTELNETNGNNRSNESHGMYATVKSAEIVEDNVETGPTSSPPAVYAGLNFSDDSLRH